MQRHLIRITVLLGLAGLAQAAEQQLDIAPHATDPQLAEGEPAHRVVYDADDAAPLLLVWLPGTGGEPTKGPRLLFETVREQGYRLLALSYRNRQAVSQVCVGARLRAEPDCAQRMRQQRSWGGPPSGLVDDPAGDGIVPRLTRLLQHLARTDPAGRWDQYLQGEEPRWSRIVLAGQSQGGGMAAFIAQTREVAGVISFSGGWDRGADGGLAGWYSRRSATPASRWHASFHVQEPQAEAMAQIAQRLGLPPEQVHALDLPVRGRGAHGEGIANPAYRELWRRMLPRQP